MGFVDTVFTRAKLVVSLYFTESLPLLVNAACRMPGMVKNEHMSKIQEQKTPKTTKQNNQAINSHTVQ